MVDLYCALIIAGRRTFAQVPVRYQEAVTADLLALGLDENGTPIVQGIVWTAQKWAVIYFCIVIGREDGGENVLEQLRDLFQNICNNWFGGLLIGLFSYLIEPSAAFYALWIAVALDFMTKMVELSYGCGGYLNAVQTQRINSQTMFRKGFVKILAYFVLMVVAYQSKYITTVESVPIIFSSIIYGMLFLVEVHSIIENMIGAGCDDLRPLLMRFEKEREKAINGSGNLISDVITNHSETATEQTAQAHQLTDENRATQTIVKNEVNEGGKEL